MKLMVIVNPAAGGGRAGKALAGVEAALGDGGFEFHTETTRNLEHAGDLAREAAAAGETAVAFGGDGIVGAVAGALAGGQGVLGVLPGGRGNDFARVLGIPQDPVAACEILRTGVVRSLDLGAVGERTFIGIASVGFDSEANRIANETRLIGGSLVYAYGALRALMGWHPARFEVTIDGGPPISMTGYTVAVANSKAYGGGMYLAPDAALDDGLFDVVMTADTPRLRFLRLLPTVFKGEHIKQPGVAVLRGAEVHVSADRPFTMYADGDPIGELPATIRVLPAAIRVIVPA
jgi:YegS/Rv2252/BmrU family lipid kinase